MLSTLRSTWAVKASAVGASMLLASVALVATSGTASAGTTVKAKYKVTGSTFLARPNFTMALGPGTLKATANLSNGKLTAVLSLPDATGSFKQFGVIPVTATTQFINDGKTTGTLNLKTGQVKTTSKITLRIVSLSVLGISLPVGDSCETSSPVVVSVKSQRGFNLLNGGKLAGGYTIGKFSGCGLLTLLINATIPGSGNTITLKLGKAKIG